MRSLLLIPVLAVAGCAASSVNAPSLLPRPIEALSTAEPVADDATVAADPVLDAAITNRVAAIRTSAAAFDAVRVRSEPRIVRARGAREGSDAWLDAQQALGEVQQARTASEAAMAELEALAIERAGAGRLPYPALDAAIAAAQADLTRQTAAETALKARVGG